MLIISPLFFALSSNSDALVIGISYGAKKIHFNTVSNIIIALIAGGGTFCSMLFGQIINSYISPQLGSLIGGLSLILFGIYMLIDTIRKKTENSNTTIADVPETNYFNKVLNHPEIIDTNNSDIIEFKEAFVLGGLLCLNNLGMGIGASIAGLNIYITSFFSFLFSIGFLHIGCYMGQKLLSTKFSTGSEFISASIIILLGVSVLIT
ncbi:sporulation membrane protein YtaF [Alkalibaculum sp. M08DMB]|uniref:Sporulation membrane protein YtaF n=1 Tax=Alkalibaculum sporogenes TaxID=2655001 RepID=A0A6A7K8J8_9FIRM|nr:sporulation membrane protein YtaF [Alkalibaculum sporogenes]MPW25744.1 sporulation membrane protein YtaF [Alkalibaculum sporogenes]